MPDLRMLPHNDEAERAILGSLLMDSEVFDKVSSIVKASDFYNPNNQIIFSAIEELLSDGKVVDSLTLIEFLTKHGHLEKAGGRAYIAELTDYSTISSLVESYSFMVREASRRRALYKISMRLSNDSFDESKDISTSIDTGSNELNDLLLTVNTVKTEDYFDSIVGRVTENILNALDGNDSGDKPIETGFDLLDKYCNGGFAKEDYIIVAARPSIGKTAFGISMMHNMVKSGKNVLFFSLEMSSEKIAQRVLAAESKVNLSKIIKKSFLDDEVERFVVATENLYNYGHNFYIKDIPNIPLSDLRSLARAVNKNMEGGLDCIVIDYIGLISLNQSGPGSRDLTDYERVTRVSKGLKQLARELKVPVVALCQVSRDSEEKEPVLSNLRDSGAIEQDADVVCFLHRKRMLTEEEKQRNARDNEGRATIQVTKLIVAKNRNGETGSFKIGYHAETTTFVNVDQSAVFIETTPPEKKSK